MSRLEKANRFIAACADLVDPRYPPAFHAAAPIRLDDIENRIKIALNPLHLEAKKCLNIKALFHQNRGGNGFMFGPQKTGF